MPFLIRPFCRFPEPSSVTFHASTRLKLPLAYCSAFWVLSTFLVLRGVM